MTHDTYFNVASAPAPVTRRAFLIGGSAAAMSIAVPAFGVAAALPRDGIRPTDGALTTTKGTITSLATDVDARDYVINARFRNPYTGDPRVTWDYGFTFRRNERQETFFSLNSAGLWRKNLYRFTGDTGVYQPEFQREGAVPTMKLGTNETNDVQLVVTGDVGELLVNGRSIAALNLAENGDGGDVRIGTGYYNTTGSDLTIDYRNFYVAPPPPPSAFARRAADARYGPAHGAITYGPSGSSVRSVFPVVTARDGVVSARFFNPYATARALWDYGFGFRRSETKLYRVVLRGDRTWELSYAAKEATESGFSLASTTVVRTGPAAPLRVGEGESNDVRLEFRGARGILSVNGMPVADLDLAAHTEVGAINIATQFGDGSGIEGELLRYEDFTIT